MTPNMDVIQTVLAFQTSDGERFHDLTQAQGHARRRLIDGLYLHAAKQDVAFAALPRELMIDFLMKHSKDVAKVHSLTLAPEALTGEEARLAGASAITRAERPVATAPAFAGARSMVEGGLVGDAIPPAARPFPPKTEPQAPSRLQSAMRTVDSEEAKRRDDAVEAEAVRVLQGAL